MNHVVELGDPCLRTPATPVLDPCSPDTLRIIQQMVVALKGHRGIGIAAPQIGISKQLFIVAPHQSIAHPYTSLTTGLVVINPSISILTDDVTYEWEGCLSIPGLRGYIPRQCHIMIEYHTIHGDRVSDTYDGFTARIFLHEYDHLFGTVFLDRVEDIKKHLITDGYYETLEGDDSL